MSNLSALIDLIIKNELQGTPTHEFIVELGNTPDSLIQFARFPELQLAIKASTIAKICFDHGISTPTIKRLSELLANPKSIYHSATQKGVVVVTFEIKAGSPIVIPIHPNRPVGRKTYNLVASMYAKEGIEPEIRWEKDGLLIHKFDNNL